METLNTDNYDIREVEGIFYEFKKIDGSGSIAYVNENDLCHIEGYSTGDNRAFVKSYYYNLFGNYEIRQVQGVFYEAITKNKYGVKYIKNMDLDDLFENITLNIQ